jgi:thioredoxin
MIKKIDDMATINLTKGGFLKRVADYENNPQEWKFLGDKPALIDFYASWCGPCKALSPILDELAKEYAGKVDVYKVNVDDEPELAAQFGVSSIPTLAVVKNGKIVNKSAGAKPKPQILKLLES